MYLAHTVNGVRVLGPGIVNPDNTVTWEGNARCGNPLYSYKWYKGPTPSSLSFTGVTGPGYTESNFQGEGEFYLKVAITDQDGRVASDLHHVQVNEEGCGTEIICTQSVAAAEALPQEFALEGSAPNLVQAGARADPLRVARAGGRRDCTLRHARARGRTARGRAFASWWS